VIGFDLHRPEKAAAVLCADDERQIQALSRQFGEDEKVWETGVLLRGGKIGRLQALP
jgi:hypothetical protein